MNDADLAEFVELQKTLADSAKSWKVDAKAIDPATFDLSVSVRILPYLSIGGGLDLTMGGHPVDLSGGTRVPQGRGPLKRFAPIPPCSCRRTFGVRCTGSSIGAT